MSKQAPAKNNYKEPNKAQLVQKLLRSAKGSWVGEIAEATGWQPHGSRAFLSGLCKKGHDVARAKRKGDTTFYCLLKVSTAGQPSEHKEESKQQEIA